MYDVVQGQCIDGWCISRTEPNAVRLFYSQTDSYGAVKQGRVNSFAFLRLFEESYGGVWCGKARILFLILRCGAVRCRAVRSMSTYTVHEQFVIRPCTVCLRIGANPVRTHEVDIWASCTLTY